MCLVLHIMMTFKDLVILTVGFIAVLVAAHPDVTVPVDWV